MDQKGDCTIETANQTHDCCLRKTLVLFLVPISIIYFLVSYFPVLHLFFFVFPDSQFHALVFSLFAHTLDRKCMFLISNGIIALLAKNFNLNATGLNWQCGFMKNINDVLSMEYADHSPPLNLAVSHEENNILLRQEKFSYGDSEEETKGGTVLLDSEYWGEEEEEKEEEEEEVGEEKSEGDRKLRKEEVNDMRVSTEELNNKFEEFIRKMKEEIRIEARQQYIIAV